MNPNCNFLVALTAMACSAGAVAQSSVTVYGVVDTGVEYANNQPNGGNSVVRMTAANLSGPRWGLRGVEDLGGGLKGIFLLESGYEADTGRSGQSGRLFGRSAYVGLDSQFGAIRLGRQNNSLFDIMGEFDPTQQALRYSVLVQDGAFSGRADNTVKYVGAFGPLRASAMYSFGTDSAIANGSEVPGNSKLGREYGGYLIYSVSAVSVSAVYDEINTGTVTRNPDATTRRATLAGTVDLGNTTIYAGYRWAKAYNGALLAGAPAGDKQRSNLWWTGVRWRAKDAVTLAAGAYYQDFATSNADPWLFVAQGVYSFSKRTDAYLTVAYTKNRSGSNLGVGNGGSGFGTVVAGANQLGALVGLRHKF